MQGSDGSLPSRVILIAIPEAVNMLKDACLSGGGRVGEVLRAAVPIQ